MKVESHLAHLVAFPSVSSRPNSAIVSYLIQALEPLGFRCETFSSTDGLRNNLVATIGPSVSGGLTLSGHMDVVPTEGQPWDSDPFKLRRHEGLLYGRGTADMKGFFAATLCALETFEASLFKRPLVLIWTYDEEIGCLGSQALVPTLQSDGRPLPKACLIGEPTDFQILRMHPGHVGLSVTLSGRAAHSSRPDLGVNAIYGLEPVIREIRCFEHEIQSERAFEDLLERPWVAMNLALVSGGNALNIVPDQVKLSIGYRPLPGQQADDVYQRLRERLLNLPQTALRGVAISTSLDRVTPSLLTPAGTALERHLQEHSMHPTCGAATFATDGGNLSKLGLDCLIFGPGSINVAHKANEFIPVDQLHHSIKVLERLIGSHCVNV